MKTMECRRDLVVNCPADQVWEWLSDIRNAMTSNQFHLSIDCDDTKAANPHVGMDVPILHGVMGWKVYRIARITKYQDYEIAWGERVPDDFPYPDTFPHSEGWKVESLGSNQCRIQTHLRGRFMTAIGKLIGEHVWERAMPVTLDNDVEDVALAAGAIKQKKITHIPQEYDALLRIVQARTLDGEPAEEFLSKPFGTRD